MGDVDPTGDRVWREDDNPQPVTAKRVLAEDQSAEIFSDLRYEVALAARRHAELSEHADDLVAERDSLRDQLAEAMAAGQSMEGQCHDLEAERDRLRADIKMERDINLASGCPDCGVHDGCYRVVDERDRLRAVVEAAMLLWYATYPTDNPRPELIAARNDFEQAAAQLDVSPTGDDT
jgi:hypothetical protein